MTGDERALDAANGQVSKTNYYEVPHAVPHVPGKAATFPDPERRLPVQIQVSGSAMNTGAYLSFVGSYRTQPKTDRCPSPPPPGRVLFRRMCVCVYVQQTTKAEKSISIGTWCVFPSKSPHTCVLSDRDRDREQPRQLGSHTTVSTSSCEGGGGDGG